MQHPSNFCVTKEGKFLKQLRAPPECALLAIRNLDLCHSLFKLLRQSKDETNEEAECDDVPPWQRWKEEKEDRAVEDVECRHGEELEGEGESSSCKDGEVSEGESTQIIERGTKAKQPRPEDEEEIFLRSKQDQQVVEGGKRSWDTREEVEDLQRSAKHAHPEEEVDDPPEQEQAAVIPIDSINDDFAIDEFIEAHDGKDDESSNQEETEDDDTKVRRGKRVQSCGCGIHRLAQPEPSG